MGRHQRRFGKRKGRKPIPAPSQDRENGSDYVMTVVGEGNFKMESYYAAQGLYNYRWDDASGDLVACADDEQKIQEQRSWKLAMGKVLPSSFRINKDLPENLQEKLEEELHELLKNADTGDAEAPVCQKLRFTSHGYQLSLDRSSIRKHPSLGALKEWLKTHTECGHVSRQETVSMIPPVALAPSPTDAVIDLCAAPGSKTGQLLEELGPNGFMLANDANPQRAYMLVTQLRRILHNKPVVLITACEAQFFPAITQFDRVLADVPCSGDGTSRKNINVWKTWSQMSALALHPLQSLIAWKGASQLLKVGGYMVYSTCSMNPIENEAVVANILRQSEGKLELLEVNLEGFKTRPGWNTWKVLAETKSRKQMKDERNKNNEKMQQKRQAYSASNADGNENGAASHEESKALHDEFQEDIAKTKQLFQPEKLDEETSMSLATEAGFHHFTSFDEVPDHLQKRIRTTVFPPTSEEIEKYNLQRCIRVLPQDNDTGGFFIALLRKTDQISRKDRGEKSLEDEEEADHSPALKKPRKGGNDDIATSNNNGDDDEEAEIENLDVDNKPISGIPRPGENGEENYVPASPEIFGPLIEYYGFSSGFPKDLFMIRSNGDGKIIQYVAPPVKAVLDLGIQKRIKIINTGLKAFVRNNQDCEVDYRVAQEAIHFIYPYMTKRKFSVDLDDFKLCLVNQPVAITAFSESFQNDVRPLSVGSFVVVLKGFENKCDRKMALTMWRCRGDNINALVAKTEIHDMDTKLGGIAGEIKIDCNA